MPGSLPFEPQKLRALVFDVDGTLYRPGRVKRGMLKRLVRAHLTQPRALLRTLRGLQAYRKTHERLRGREGEGGGFLGEVQLSCAADLSGLDRELLAGLVERWMEREPLDLVAAARRPGLVKLLERARERGLSLGVYSDYPARAKLEALQVAPFFEAVVCAQDPEVGKLKPDPRGIRRALALLGADPEGALYVGDRVGIDDAAAALARTSCAILVEGGAAPAAGLAVAVRGFGELSRLLFG